ncbi:MAG: hypothetical protein FD143_112 [Ignavibacteria bacterium]|nr:MAG: hypothetical protein FD143_112 [Ignavibacteria bacterium]KAF0162474.1 MAG: hypothetical protein FD188_77 [Ignavibacteria bacterium]
MESLEIKISQLVDNELDETEQIAVFSVLANDSKARKAYSDLLKIKREVTNHHAEVRTDLFPLRTLQPVQGFVRTNVFKIGFAFSSVAAIVLLMMLWFGQNKYNLAEEKFNSLLEKYNSIKYLQIQQDKVEMKSSESSREFTAANKKAIHTKERKSNKSVAAEVPATKTFEQYKKNTEISLANRVVINKDDFIGGQIVSN